MNTQYVVTKFHQSKLKVAIMAILASQANLAFADDSTQPTTTLETLSFKSVTNPDASITSTPNINTKTNKQITEQLIMDNHDLVRYNPEASVGEVGRYGAKGFSIQGVDGNRVAMLVDGMKVPDSEANEFYIPYGYVNDSRFMSDVETLKSVDIKKGADSLDSGNGAIGGAVVYQTKEPKDLIKRDKQLGGYVKTGYTNKNEEFMNAIGLAGSNQTLSALVNYVYREGHELKNHEMKRHDKAEMDPYYFVDNPNYPTFVNNWVYRQLPDPSHYEQHATIAKFYYHPTDEHQVGVHGSYQYLLNHNNAVSKGTTPNQKRIGYDENERKAYGINYRFTPQDSKWLSSAKFDLTKQQVVTVGDTFKYPEPNQKLTLDNREYRPNYFDTRQYSLELQTKPLLSPQYKWLGEHSLKATLRHTADEYDPYSVFWWKNEKILDPSTMQIQTKTDATSLSLSDNIYLNPKFSMNAGIRHDNYKRTPTMHDWQRKHFEVLVKQGTKTGIVNAYREGGLDSEQKKNATTWQLGLQFTPIDDLQLSYQASTGFLMPLVNQMYAGFAMNGIEQVPNGNLKPETSFNQQVALQKQWPRGYIKLTGYHNDYKDFITQYNWGNLYQYRNIDNAKSKGLALTTNYTLEPNWQYGSIDLNGQIAYQQGKQSNGESLLSIQPLNGLLSATYHPNDDKFSVTAMARFWGAKKSKDTLRWQSRNEGFGEITELAPLRFRKSQQGGDSLDNLQTLDQFMKDAWTFDVFGNVKLTNDLSLQAGVYNLTNKKYLPWENIRPLANVGINQMVRGNGIERYTAPGRNFAVSLNYQF